MVRPATGSVQEEEEGTANIWSPEEVANATAGYIADYINEKINDYEEQELRSIDLFEYWWVDFENFTISSYKKTTANTKAL